MPSGSFFAVSRHAAISLQLVLFFPTDVEEESKEKETSRQKRIFGPQVPFPFRDIMDTSPVQGKNK
jgi:hypothetical protein